MSKIENFTEFQLEVLEKSQIDCMDVVQLMGDYHDNDMPHTLHGRIHAHIKNCSICGEMYAGYSFVVKLAGELQPKVNMPSSAKRRLRERLNATLGTDLRVE